MGQIVKSVWRWHAVSICKNNKVRSSLQHHVSSQEHTLSITVSHVNVKRVHTIHAYSSGPLIVLVIHDFHT